MPSVAQHLHGIEGWLAVLISAIIIVVLVWYFANPEASRANGRGWKVPTPQQVKSSAKAQPQGPAQQLDGVRRGLEHIEAKLAALVQLPPSGGRADEVRQLHGHCHRALEKLDAIQTGGAAAARQQRRALVQQAQELLDQMEALPWANRASALGLPSDGVLAICPAQESLGYLHAAPRDFAARNSSPLALPAPQHRQVTLRATASRTGDDTGRLRHENAGSAAVRRSASRSAATPPEAREELSPVELPEQHLCCQPNREEGGGHLAQQQPKDIDAALPMKKRKRFVQGIKGSASDGGKKKPRP